MSVKYIAFGVSALAMAVGLSGCIGEDAINSCTLDAINGSSELSVYSKPGEISFLGWAVDVESGKVPEKLAIKLQGDKGKSFIFDYSGVRMERPKVSESLGSDNKALNMSGFSFSGDGKALPVDNYAVSLLIYRDEKAVVCPTNKKLIIQD